MHQQYQFSMHSTILHFLTITHGAELIKQPFFKQRRQQNTWTVSCMVRSQMLACHSGIPRETIYMYVTTRTCIPTLRKIAPLKLQRMNGSQCEHSNKPELHIFPCNQDCNIWASPGKEETERQLRTGRNARNVTCVWHVAGLHGCRNRIRMTG